MWKTQFSTCMQLKNKLVICPEKIEQTEISVSRIQGIKDNYAQMIYAKIFGINVSIEILWSWRFVRLNSLIFQTTCSKWNFLLLNISYIEEGMRFLWQIEVEQQTKCLQEYYPAECPRMKKCKLVNAPVCISFIRWFSNARRVHLVYYKHTEHHTNSCIIPRVIWRYFGSSYIYLPGKSRR